MLNKNRIEQRIDEDDLYVVGNFNGGDGDDLLAFSSETNKVHLLIFGKNSDKWQSLWQNENGMIGGWNFDTDDRFFAGDFDGDGVDEVFLFSPSSDWASLFSYEGTDFEAIWINEGSGTIHYWGLDYRDLYLIGTFYGVQDNLLTINYSDGWSHLINYIGLPAHPSNYKNS